MGFYGNIADTSRIHFQFDKIFENRRAMDLACYSGTDGIFAGRFVLVNYDPESRFFSGDILSGYQGIDGRFYADFAKTMPYIYSSFQQVSPSEVNDSDWDKYYWKSGNYYFKLPSETYYDPAEAELGNYWKPTIADGDNRNIVSINQLLRFFTASGEPTETLYKCIGGTNGGNPQWSEVLHDEGYPTYLVNYNIDKTYYSINYDRRGYDGTVWQKIYSEGHGKFILVARLNGLMPALELFSDAPSIDPQAPYIDAKSSDALYRIHVPSMWGLQIKPATSTMDGEGNVTYSKSDQIVSSANGLVHGTTRADIYMNLGGPDPAVQSVYHKNESHKDTETPNEVILDPHGKTGKTYWDRNGQRVDEDIIQLSIHAPVFGNMIDEAYDLIYGTNAPYEDEDTHEIITTRPRDITWYAGDSSLRNEGSPDEGGKSYDLNTLAGTLNTFHKRLGQNIIYEYNEMPSMETKKSLSPDYIYYISNLDTYYRKGKTYTFTPVGSANATISFRKIGHLTEQEYIGNTYYYTNDTIPANQTDFTPQELNFIVANGDYRESDYANTIFFVKNIQANRYHRVNLTYYRPDTYYYISNQDYLLDHNPIEPLDISQQYVNLLAGDIHGPYTFSKYYRQNQYYYKDQNDNFILETRAIPPYDNSDYYSLQLGQSYPGYVFYQKNKYFLPVRNEYNEIILNSHGEPAFYTLDTRDSLPESDQIGFPHYALVFKPDASYGVDDDGNFTQIYQIDTATPVYLLQTPAAGTSYYVLQGSNLIDIKNIEDLSISRTYVEISNVANVGSDFYLPGKYYTHEEDGSYLLSLQYGTNATQYYQISKATPIPYPFYEADKYYYNAGGDFYYKDTVKDTAHRQHWIKDQLFVISDPSGRCPIGYEWNDYSLFVPASITLGLREEQDDLIPIKGIVDDSISLHGALLNFDKLYNPDDYLTRDLNTLTGALNTNKDLFFTMKHLIPGRILYVNEFGQITSSEDGITYEDLKNLINNS